VDRLSEMRFRGTKNPFPKKMPMEGEPKIPFRTHRIWLTNVAKPREYVDDRNMIPLQKYMVDMLNELDSRWEHNLWVQDASLVPETVRMFQEVGIQPRSLSELKHIKPEEQAYLDKYSPYKPGRSSDMARNLILREFGGIYVDIDEYIHNFTTKVNYQFDFFTSVLDMRGDGLVTFENQLMGCRPFHPVIDEYVKVILNFEGVLKTDKAPSFAQGDCWKDSDSLDQFAMGPGALLVAFYRKG